MSFRLVLKLATLNALERRNSPYFTEFAIVSGAHLCKNR